MKEGLLTFDHKSKIFEQQEPSFAEFTKIVKPSEVPKRKHFDTLEGQCILLHAIAHIEYSAIDLALDSAYRFRDMPLEYYMDWVEVAADEVRHFRMLEELMIKRGINYGDLPVHTLLFDAGKRSGCDILHRMAVVPRYLEAGGLDANPKIVQKLKSSSGRDENAPIVEALEVILEEEIEHVNKGDRWFKYVAGKRGLSEEVYFEILQLYYPGYEKRGAWLNVEARLKAGFSCGELKRMGAKKCD
ncbi:MAG: ferritin-like domain-containing protein [Hydrogenimonas sp.]|nr:ferritin-like domain-containing protein [Hydrogenimonas sp.]